MVKEQKKWSINKIIFLIIVLIVVGIISFKLGEKNFERKKSFIANKNQEYVCDCSRTCDQMSSCDEAQYQLNTCGCFKRDGDRNGSACDSICK